MTLIAVGSVHGSPGVTSLAVDLARTWSGEALLIEADPDGGVLAARLDLAVKPGLMELAGAARTGIDTNDLWKFAQPIAGDVGVVVAHPAAEQTGSALRAALAHVIVAAQGIDALVVVDIGRLRPGSPALIAPGSASHTVIMSSNSVEPIVSLTHRAQLIAGCSSPVVVLNQAHPYSAAEVAAASRQHVWGVVPHGQGRRDERLRCAAVERLLTSFSSTPISPLLADDLPHDLVVTA
jgi:hypothetical protein